MFDESERLVTFKGFYPNPDYIPYDMVASHEVNYIPDELVEFFKQLYQSLPNNKAFNSDTTFLLALSGQLKKETDPEKIFVIQQVYYQRRHSVITGLLEAGFSSGETAIIMASYDKMDQNFELLNQINHAASQSPKFHPDADYSPEPVYLTKDQLIDLQAQLEDIASGNMSIDDLTLDDYLGLDSEPSSNFTFTPELNNIMGKAINDEALSDDDMQLLEKAVEQFPVVELRNQILLLQTDPAVQLKPQKGFDTANPGIIGTLPIPETPNNPTIYFGFTLLLIALLYLVKMKYK